MSLVKAIVRNNHNHVITIALNDLFPESSDAIRAEFNGLLPKDNIRVWHTPSPVCEYAIGNVWRRRTAELLREAFFTSLQPDVVLVASFIEGFSQNVVTSIGSFTSDINTVTILYDLIPLLNPTQYLDISPYFKKHYMRKIRQLKNSDGILTISDYSAMEGITSLSLNKQIICNISSGCDDIFRQNNNIQKIKTIHQSYILYTGGVDARKNIQRLIEAYAIIPKSLREKYKLIIVGKIKKWQKFKIELTAIAAGLNKNDIQFMGYVSDEELVSLYRQCTVFVFPSWHEGFGLPALEAINCGTPVIGANTSSLPEVIGCEEALFNPFDANDMAQKLQQSLCDATFREQIKSEEMRHAAQFSWDVSAKRAIDFIETLPRKQVRTLSRDTIIDSLIEKISQIEEGEPTETDLKATALAIAQNHPIVI